MRFTNRLGQQITRYCYRYGAIEPGVHSLTLAIPADRILERLTDHHINSVIHAIVIPKTHWHDVFTPLLYQLDRQKVIKPPGTQHRPAYLSNDYRPVKTKIIRDKIALYIAENAP